MTRTSVREYLAKQRERYQQLARRDRSRLLTEIVAVTGYHRKAVLRSLSVLPRRRAGRRPVGRPRRYGADVARVAQVLWQAAGQIGAKRLQPFVPALLDRLVACGELSVSAATATQVRQVSTATLERLLAPARRLAPRRGRSTTQPGGWLKQQIPIRTFAEWDDARPGFLEVDLVAHCGEDGGGFFLHTLCAVDVATGWVELQPVWGKGHTRVKAALHEIRGRLPVPLRGLDSDNGSEFINRPLYYYCWREGIVFTRRRTARSSARSSATIATPRGPPMRSWLGSTACSASTRISSSPCSAWSPSPATARAFVGGMIGRKRPINGWRPLVSSAPNAPANSGRSMRPSTRSAYGGISMPPSPCSGACPVANRRPPQRLTSPSLPGNPDL